MRSPVNLRTYMFLGPLRRKKQQENLQDLPVKPVPLEVGATYGYYSLRQNRDPLEASRR